MCSIHTYAIQYKISLHQDGFLHRIPIYLPIIAPSQMLSWDFSPLREVNLLEFSSSKPETDEKANYLSFMIRIHY